MRALPLAQLALGAALLTRPRELAVAVTPPGQTVPPAAVGRVLGARLIGQGVAALVRPSRTVLIGSALVDLAHGASMVALAAVAPQYRRVAVVNTVAAAGSAAASATAGLRAR